VWTSNPHRPLRQSNHQPQRHRLTGRKIRHRDWQPENIGAEPVLQPKNGLVAIIDSNDYLEIALKDGSAAALLGSKAGDKLILREE